MPLKLEHGVQEWYEDQPLVSSPIQLAIETDNHVTNRLGIPKSCRIRDCIPGQVMPNTSNSSSPMCWTRNTAPQSTRRVQERASASCKQDVIWYVRRYTKFEFKALSLKTAILSSSLSMPL
jgi:hypothetical protein